MDTVLFQTLTSMPKVELHAHLNGSISDDLLQHLKVYAENDEVALHDSKSVDDYPSLEANGILMPSLEPQNSAKINEESDKARSLKECWDAFAKVHEVVRTSRILYVATVNVIADFSRENVVYLELRTGPKKIHKITSKEAYLEAVIIAIRAAKEKFPISVKLLISVDRKNGEESALENIQLAVDAQKKYPDVIVGVDISGDPTCGHFSWIVGIMEEARANGLKISCHLPEVVNPDEGIAFLKFGPERVGHGQYLHPMYGGTEELWRLAKTKKIPIECCISSNLVSGVTSSLDTHVVKILHQEKLPFIICTDDYGVFKTTLSAEFRKFLRIVPLNHTQLQELGIAAVDYAFTSNEEKVGLKKIISEWWDTFNKLSS